MARYQVILTYDGTHFYGFQKQGNARTVQAVLETTLCKMGWQNKTLLYAGRTDAGAHALGQVIAFDMEWKHSIEELRQALNAHLPNDVAALSVLPVRADFHPRYAALRRCYQYRLFCSETRQPLRERYSWRVWPSVQLMPMQEAATHILGTHDFAAFGSPTSPKGSTIRTIYEAQWHQDGMDFFFEIVGNAFLYHMIRRMVFFMVEIGQGKRQPEDILVYLDRIRTSASLRLAPPHGLYLMEVTYPLDIYDIDES